jgi:hypothetical protein
VGGGGEKYVPPNPPPHTFNSGTALIENIEKIIVIYRKLVDFQELKIMTDEMCASHCIKQVIYSISCMK